MTEPFVLKIAINFFRPIPVEILIAVVIPLSRVIVGIGINTAIVRLVYGYSQFDPDALWAATILIVVFVHIVQTLERNSPAR